MFDAPADLVSFDVFDTLLLRRCTTPAGVHERTFALVHPPVDCTMAEVFVQHRQLAEANARKAAERQNGSPEVTIKAIYDHFPVKLFGLTPGDRSRLVAAEWAAERDLCFANPTVLELVQQVRATGARVGFVSDTYWDGERLAALLRHAVPNLQWDFLYASCDHGRGKRDGLLSLMLAGQGIAAARAVHLGDNPAADVQAARRAGLRAVHLPQCDPALTAVFQREDVVFPLFCGWNGASPRLDGGARTARRLVAQAATGDDAFDYGLNVLGPILAAFDRFVADRVARLQQDGRRVAVAFLGRDGLAALEVWRTSRQPPAAYAEINRRVAILAAARSAAPLAEFFTKVPMVDHGVATGFLGMDTPRLRAAFRNGPMNGASFAHALPDLITPDQVTSVTDPIRTGLFAHLRAEIADFDTLSDLVLVDIGYTGTVQKALRALFTDEGLPHRLHGLYLTTQDEHFCDLPDGDSAEGLIDDTVLLARSKGLVLSNIGVLEQLCAATTGSVRGHAPDGTPHHEPDPRPPEQRALCERVRQGAVAHARALGEQPAANACWAAAILTRALLLPTDGELALLDGMKRDVNLGSQVLAPLADADMTGALLAAQGLPQAFTPRELPAWLGAGVSQLSPLLGFVYAVGAAHGLPGDVLGETPQGKSEIALIGATAARTLAVTRLRTENGDLRLRLPLRRDDAIHTVAIPGCALPRRGLVRAVTVQAGATATEALRSGRVTRLENVEGLDMHVDRGLYQVGAEDGRLLLHPPPLDAAIGILTLTVTALE